MAPLCSALTVCMGKLKPWIVIALVPYVCWLLSAAVDWGLIPLFIETLYFFPVSWVGEPLFRSVEAGIVVPSHLGRFLGVVLYSIMYWVFFLVLQNRRGRGGAS